MQTYWARQPTIDREEEEKTQRNKRTNLTYILHACEKFSAVNYFI